MRTIGRDDLSPTGEGQAVVTGGMSMAGHALIVTLRRRREGIGLSVEEVARRSRPGVETIAGLEGRRIVNPPLDAPFRCGMALNAPVTLGFEEIGGTTRPRAGHERPVRPRIRRKGD